MTGNGSTRFTEGRKIRSEVLGAAHVAQATGAGSGFSSPMQEFVTECCWGSIWSRPGLDRKTRSIINLALLSALNRPHELRAHVRGAIRNGCTPEEIQEVLLQVAAYCGMPAGMDAFRNAEAALQGGG